LENNLLGKIERMEMADESAEIKKLKKEKRRVRNCTSKSVLKTIASEFTIESAKKI